MRVLLVVLSPLSAELGAAQMALNLAEALRAIGVDVKVWSPTPIPPEVRWWRRVAWIRMSIPEYVVRSGPFDFVDVPPVAISGALARVSRVIARSVQPDLAYLWVEQWFGPRVRPASIADRVALAFYNLYLGTLVVTGWFHAWRILCLGSREYKCMRQWLPWWRDKIAMYVNAIADSERKDLAGVRARRASRTDRGTRFLWLGRWTAQKGADRLVAFIRQNIGPESEDKVTIAGCGKDAEKDIPPEVLKQSNVRVVPFYDRSGLVSLLQDHDAGLFTSRTEGWGLTLQEMLESGMCVYATGAGATFDLRADFPETLRLFPPILSGDVLSQSQWLPRAEYLERYSWTAIAKEYRDALSRSGNSTENKAENKAENKVG